VLYKNLLQIYNGRNTCSQADTFSMHIQDTVCLVNVLECQNSSFAEQLTSFDIVLFILYRHTCAIVCYFNVLGFFACLELLSVLCCRQTVLYFWILSHNAVINTYFRAQAVEASEKWSQKKIGVETASGYCWSGVV